MPSFISSLPSCCTFSSLVPSRGAVYAGSTTIMTLALTILSCKNWGVFNGFSAGVFLTQSYIVTLITINGRTAQNHDQRTIVAVTGASCMLSAISAVCIFHSVVFFRDGWNELSRGDIRESVSCFYFSFALLGYGIPTFKAFYQRGKELLHSAEWPALKQYMDQQVEISALQLSNVDYILFFLGITVPDFLEKIPIGGPIRLLTIGFCSEEHQIDRIKRIIDCCRGKSPEAARLLWNFAFSQFLNEEKNWKWIPTILQIARDMPKKMRDAFKVQTVEELLPPNVRASVLEKKQDLSRNYNAIIEGFQNRLKELKQKLEPLNLDSDSKEKLSPYLPLSQELSKLMQDVSQYHEQVEAYCMELDREPLNKIQHELLRGEIHTKIQRLRSKVVADKGIDLEQDTWDYFLTVYGEQAYRKLIEMFKLHYIPELALTRDPLHKALQSYQIETIGGFIEKVLNKQGDVLLDQSEVIKRLEEFLKNNQTTALEFRNSAILQTSLIYQVALSAIFIGMMFFSTSIPMILSPTGAFAGVGAAFAFYKSDSVHQVTELLFAQFSEFRDLFGRIRVAIRRPFLRMFLGEFHDLNDYKRADFAGKMRILSYELSLLRIVLSTVFLVKPAGGFVQGFAIGRELFYKPANVV